MTTLSNVCFTHPSLKTTAQSKATLLRKIVPLILIGAMALIHVYRSPADVSGVMITPDEVEYAVGAQRLAMLGRYDISIDGRSLPPRYPPWFSLMLAPIYFIWPQQIGAGIVLVQGFAVLAAIAAFMLGRRIAGSSDLAGVLAAASVVMLDRFDTFARFIMSDVPSAALWLILAWSFITHSASNAKDMWKIGLLIAMAVAIRTTNLWLILPFAFYQTKSLRNWFALMAPTGVILMAQAGYQSIVFGSAMRSGYHVWCPIPYDFPSRVFSPAFIAANLEMLQVYLPLLLLGIIAAVILARGNDDSNKLLRFVLLSALPLSLMHLFYFTAASRFHLPLLCLSAVLAGAGIASVLRIGHVASSTISLAVVSFVTLMPASSMIDSPGIPQLVRENLVRATPDHAVILTLQDLVWMEPGIRNSNRRLIPLTRQQEYASKRLAYQPLRKAEELNDPAKTRTVVEYAVEDDPGRIARWLALGESIYLDVSLFDYGSPLTQQLLEQCSIRRVPGRLDLWKLTASAP